MSAFSASDAALEGFRITRENPGAFMRWVLVSFVVSILGAIVSVSMPAEVRDALATINADETPTLTRFGEALLALAPLLAFGLAVQCMMAAAVYRLILRHDDTRFGYLRLGLDEVRLMVLTLMYVLMFIAFMVLITLGAALVMSVAAFAGQNVMIFVGAATELFLLGLVVYVGVRLSLAPVATFAEKRLSLFESWELTRGQFWRLLGAYVLALACVVVLGLLALVVFTAVAGVFVVATGGQMTDLGEVFKPDESSLRAYFTPALVAYMFVGSVFSALYYAVIAAPGAVAYQSWHSANPPPAPLQAQMGHG
jgi:hypothetical protein